MTASAILEVLTQKLDRLPTDVSIERRAAIVAGQGIKVWFAVQGEDNTFELLPAPGGIAAPIAEAFTTDVVKLADGGAADSFMALIPDGADMIRAVWNNRSRSLDVWTEYVKIDLGGAARSCTVSLRPAHHPAPTPDAAVQVMSPRRSVASFKRAKERLTKAAAHTAQCRARQSTIAASRAQAISAAAEARRAIADQMADDVIAGRELRETSGSAERVRQLSDEATAAEAALPKAAELTRQAEVQERVARSELAEAVLDWAASHQVSAIERCRSIVNELRDPLVLLTAVDRIKREQSAGAPSTRRPNHPGLVSGERIASRLIKETPAAFRPVWMDAEKLEVEIARTAVSLRSQLSGED